MIRQVVFILLLSLALRPAAAIARQNASPASVRPPAELLMTRLTADAVLPVALEAGAAGSADAVWVPNRGAGTVVRIDAKDNKPGLPIVAGAQPCASLLVAFDTLWVPLCGDRAMARVDVKVPKVSGTVKAAVADAEGRVATAVGSIWAVTDRKGVVSRIDPDTNAVVAEIYVGTGAAAIAGGDDALWVTSAESNELTRVNPHTNEIVEVVSVGKRPGRLAVGEGGVWVLNRGDATVSRVDPATNKVVATIKIGEDAAGGEIAAGAGSVWISAPTVPIIRIDPRTDRAVQRFTGTGGGAILVAHDSLWVAAGPQATWRLDPVLVAAIRP